MEETSITFRHHQKIIDHVLGLGDTASDSMATPEGMDRSPTACAALDYNGRLSPRERDAKPTSATIGSPVGPHRLSTSAFGRSIACLSLLLLSVLVSPASAVFINYENCLSLAWQNQKPLYLQFVPLYVNAVFNTTDSAHNLNVTVWGNITGSLPLVSLPSANSSDWTNPNVTDGKIVNVPDPDGNNVATTLFNKVNVLSYEPYSQNENFCDQLINASCPLGPAFYANA
jgi:hypothetical protein